MVWHFFLQAKNSHEASKIQQQAIWAFEPGKHNLLLSTILLSDRDTYNGVWNNPHTTRMLFPIYPTNNHQVIQSDLFIPHSWRSRFAFEFGSRELTIPKRSPTRRIARQVVIFHCLPWGFCRNIPRPSDRNRNAPLSEEWPQFTTARVKWDVLEDVGI